MPMNVVSVLLVIFAIFILSPRGGSSEAESKKRAGVGRSGESATERLRASFNSSESTGNSTNSSHSKESEQSGLPCKDQFSDTYCKTRLLRRGKDYCKKDMYFGRMQCCGTCSKAWGAPTGDLSSGNATWTMPCTDHVAPDGTSFTGWCREFGVSAKNNSIFSCNRSLFVKYRCMRTCGFC